MAIIKKRLIKLCFRFFQRYKAGTIFAHHCQMMSTLPFVPPDDLNETIHTLERILPPDLQPALE